MDFYPWPERKRQRQTHRSMTNACTNRKLSSFFFSFFSNCNFIASNGNLWPTIRFLKKFLCKIVERKRFPLIFFSPCGWMKWFYRTFYIWLSFKAIIITRKVFEMSEKSESKRNEVGMHARLQRRNAIWEQMKRLSTASAMNETA